MEVSAQNGKNTKELFLKAVASLLSKDPDLKTDSDIQNIRTISAIHSLKGENEKEKKSCSC